LDDRLDGDGQDTDNTNEYTQNFHGNVGQVAGGNINITNHIYEKGVDHNALTDAQLRQRKAEFKRRLFKVRKLFLFSWPVLALPIYMVLTICFVFSGLLFSVPAYLFLAWALGMIVIAGFIVEKRKQYGPLIFYYKNEVARIDYHLTHRSI